MKYRDEYLKNDGGFCPYCRSDDFEGFDMEFNTGCMDYCWECLKCSRRWWDHYILEDIIEEEENGKET